MTEKMTSIFRELSFIFICSTTFVFANMLAKIADTSASEFVILILIAVIAFVGHRDISGKYALIFALPSQMLHLTFSQFGWASPSQMYGLVSLILVCMEAAVAFVHDRVTFTPLRIFGGVILAISCFY